MDKEWMILLQRQNQLSKVLETNRVTEQFGLSLTQQDAELILEERKDVLKEQKQVEFGQGFIPQIISEFCDSDISSALKAANAYKKKGIPVTEVFQYLFLLIFSNRSMYMSLITGKNAPSFAKDTVYRFMRMLQINWIRFTTILASRIIKEAVSRWIQKSVRMS